VAPALGNVDPLAPAGGGVDPVSPSLRGVDPATPSQGSIGPMAPSSAIADPVQWWRVRAAKPGSVRVGLGFSFFLIFFPD